MLPDVAPERWRVLTFGSGRLVAIRTNARTLELVGNDAPLFPVGAFDFFRNAGELEVGQTIELPGMRVTLLAFDNLQMPRRARVEFDRDLNDPSLQWIDEGQDGFHETILPGVGYGVRLAP